MKHVRPWMPVAFWVVALQAADMERPASRTNCAAFWPRLYFSVLH